MSRGATGHRARDGIAAAGAPWYPASVADADCVPIADDLAPGDRRAEGFDWSPLRLRRVAAADDPDFAAGYGRLWAEFGDRGEMERRAVIEDRLGWDPRRPIGGAALLYEMLVVRRAGALAAVRDHTAIVRVDAAGRAQPGPTVVHLSHVLVEPAYRGSGLAGWLRALPLQAARRCAAAAGQAPGAPIVLVAEMEHPDPRDPATMVRLGAYERAGFRKVDPEAAPYAQPDFRLPALLAGVTPVALPLALIVRRVGREREEAMAASELAAVVDALHAVYRPHVAANALAPLAAAARAWLASRDGFRLLPPTG